MDLGLKGRHTLVTGGAKSIGHASFVTGTNFMVDGATATRLQQ